jgi:hypothetical protein
MGWIGRIMEDRIWSEIARLIDHRQPTAVQCGLIQTSKTIDPVSSRP